MSRSFPMVVLGSTKHRKTSQAPLGRNDTCCFHRSYSIFVLRCSTDSGGNSLSHGQGHPQSNLRGRAKTSSKFSGDTAFLEGLISQIGRDVQEGQPLTPSPRCHGSHRPAASPDMWHDALPVTKAPSEWAASMRNHRSVSSID